MKTAYSLQAVLSLLCLKKELNPLIWKRTVLNTHSYEKSTTFNPPKILEVGSEDIQVVFKSLYCLVTF